MNLETENPTFAVRISKIYAALNAEEVNESFIKILKEVTLEMGEKKKRKPLETLFRN